MEEIDEALERLEVEEPIRVEMRCEISGDVRMSGYDSFVGLVVQPRCCLFVCCLVILLREWWIS